MTFFLSEKAELPERELFIKFSKLQEAVLEAVLHVDFGGIKLALLDSIIIILLKY